jgi:hypothetical protein
MATRAQLQNAARTAKEHAADFQRIADKGGEGAWDADTARDLAEVSAEVADRHTRQLGKKR